MRCSRAWGSRRCRRGNLRLRNHPRTHRGHRAFRGDFPPGFYPKHLDKDITLAIDEADSLGIDLRGLKNTRARWLELLYKHPEAKAIQDLARLYM